MASGNRAAIHHLTQRWEPNATRQLRDARPALAASADHDRISAGGIEESVVDATKGRLSRTA